MDKAEIERKLNEAMATKQAERYETCKLMESNHAPVDYLISLTSIAISLKRIADEMTSRTEIKQVEHSPPELTEKMRLTLITLINSEHTQYFHCPRCGEEYKNHSVEHGDPCYPSA